MNTFGELLKIKREELNLTKTKLSEMSGISIGYLGDLEKNRKGIFPSIEKLKLIAEALYGINKEEVDLFIIESLKCKLPESITNKLNDITKSNKFKIKEIYVVGYFKEKNLEIDFNLKKESIFIKEVEDNLYAIELKKEFLEKEFLIIDTSKKEWKDINNKLVIITYNNKNYYGTISLHNNGQLILLKNENSEEKDLIINSQNIKNFNCIGKIVKSIKIKEYN